MDISHTYDDLSNNSSDHGFSERYFFSFEIKIKIALGQILHNDVDICLILKGFANTDQKILMTNSLNELALEHIEFFYLGLLNDFHCI